MALQGGGARPLDCSPGNCRDTESLPSSSCTARNSEGSCKNASGAVAPVRVTRIEVHRGHLVCLVSFADAPRVTSARLMERVLRSFPNLPRHTCVNERGATFAAVMNCTPLPHLLEHLAVDLQVRAQAGNAHAAATLPAGDGLTAAARTGSSGALGVQTGSESHERPIVGTSEWLDEASGVARIDLSFADDQIALRALRDAVAFLNEALSAEP